jgi:hypothetical protein
MLRPPLRERLQAALSGAVFRQEVAVARICGEPEEERILLVGR